MPKITKHINKSYRYAAGGMIRDDTKQPYANEWFDRPHDWDKDLGEQPLPKGMKWPGYKEDLTTPEEPEGLIPQERKQTAPVELRPRPRRKSQET